MKAPLWDIDSSLAAARELLPWWLSWQSVYFVLPLVAAVSFIAVWIGTAIARIPLSRYRGEPGFERNRHAYPARHAALMSGAVTVVLAMVVCGHSLEFPYGNQLWVLRGRRLGYVAAAVALFVSAVVHFRAMQKIRLQPPTLRELLASIVIQIAFFLRGPIIVLLFAPFVPTDPGVPMAAVLTCALLVLLTSDRAATWFLKALRLLRPAPERLARIANEVGHALACVPRHVWVTDWHVAQAYALPSQGALGFSGRALEVLSDEEIASVCAHEIAHLSEPRWLRYGRTVASLWMTPILLIAPLAHHLGVIGVAIPVAAAIVWAYLQVRLVRYGEARADEVVHRCEARPDVLAGALRSLYAANELPAHMPNLHTHPQLEERSGPATAKASGAVQRPPMWASNLGIVAALLITNVSLQGVPLAFLVACSDEPWCRMVTDSDAQVLAAEGYRRQARQPKEGFVLFRAAAAMRPNSVGYASWVAILLSRLGRCEEASLALAEAATRLESAGGERRDFDVAVRWVDDCTPAGE